jgi:hypothetical protein
MDKVALFGTAAGLGFVWGLRLYATVLMIGLGLRFKSFSLYPGIENLKAFSNPVILMVAGVGSAVELVVDKAPWLDSLWDSFHIFIRPLGAAALAAIAFWSVDPLTRTLLAIVSGCAALAAHSTKAGIRLVINHRSEPLDNIGLSLAEDLLAFGIGWMSISFPKFVLTLIAGFFAIFLAALPRLFRLVRIELTALLAVFLNEPSWTEALPRDCGEFLEKKLRAENIRVWVRCAAGSGVGGLRHSIGYLSVTDGRLIFVTRRMFNFRFYEIPLEKIERIRYRKRLLLNRLSLIRYGSRKQTFYLFKNTTHRADDIMTEINKARVE